MEAAGGGGHFEGPGDGRHYEGCGERHCGGRGSGG